MDKLKIDKLASQILTIFATCGNVDLELLKEFRDEYKGDLSKYEAIGIIDPGNYMNNTNIAKARLKRVDALIALVETLHETNDHAKLRISNTKELRSFRF